jgi:transposase
MTKDEEITTLKVENKRLAEELERLKKTIDDLGHRKNSRNSSMAPSMDLSRQSSLRCESTKANGGQVGHKGTTLRKSENPDSFIDLKPKVCSSCMGSLSQVIDFKLNSTRQVADLQNPKLFINEYRQYACSCPNCHSETSAKYPMNVNAPIQYGSKIQSIITYLSVYQYIPYFRLAALFDQIFHIPLSQGTIDNCLKSTALKSDCVIKSIELELFESTVIGSDETGIKVNREKWWAWVWQNSQNTLLIASKSRGFNTIETNWAKGLPNATLVSDRWAAQLKMLVSQNQVCLAHLLREVKFVMERESHDFLKRFDKLLRAIFKCKMENNEAYSLTSKEALEMESELKDILSISINTMDYPKSHAFQKSIIKVKDYIFPCIYDVNIPPDNNGSERAIRNLKVKMKISGQFKTGQHIFCCLRSVIDTILKRGLNLMQILRQIIELDKPQVAT